MPRAKQWDKIFKKHGKVFVKPHEAMPKLVKIFRKHKVKKILDLGSGSGRHVVYLAKHGFAVYGFDISESGIKITKDWLKENNLKANLEIGSIFQKLPYKDNFFDAVITTSAIHHARIETIRKAIKEIERVLNLKGLLFFHTRKRKFKKFWPKHKIIEKYGYQTVSYEVIAPRTYVPIEGGEKGLPHYLFNKESLKKELKNFKIHKIWVDSDNRHYCLLGELRK